MPKPPIIPSNMIMIDRAGVRWRTSPGYQDKDVRGPGWLLLRSDLGVDMEFSQVVLTHGFTDREEPYLRAVILGA
jgi:hypothetical protein